MITNQAYIFIIFVMVGIIVGIIFDFFRILRKSFKTKDFVTYIEDIVFCILTGLILLYSIFKFNSGEIRIYMFLGVLIGCSLYMLTISKYFIKINVFILTTLTNILKKIISILYIPFKYLKKILTKIFFKPISFIIINIRKMMSNIFTKSKNILKNNKKLKNKEGLQQKM